MHKSRLGTLVIDCQAEHLDIETDDIEAEVRRPEALGARPIARVKRWWVMEAPTDQRFCIVRPQRADFEANSNRWI